MKKKQIVDIIIALLLILCGSIILIFPLMNFTSVKKIFLGVLFVYGIINFIQFLLTFKEKDYEGLLTTLVCMITFIIALKLDIVKSPWYLALSLFTWIMLMSIVKLKKADYYHDRKNKIWIIKIITLVLFILSGLLAAINLYYSSDIQILILGFFYLIHGILELFDPITYYLIKKE